MAAGQLVRISNTDPFAHTITSVEQRSLRFDSGTLAQNDLVAVTFDEVGTWAWFRAIHPTMRAEVIVR